MRERGEREGVAYSTFPFRRQSSGAESAENKENQRETSGTEGCDCVVDELLLIRLVLGYGDLPYVIIVVEQWNT